MAPVGALKKSELPPVSETISLEYMAAVPADTLTALSAARSAAEVLAARERVGAPSASSVPPPRERAPPAAAVRELWLYKDMEAWTPKPSLFAVSSRKRAAPTRVEMSLPSEAPPFECATRLATPTMDVPPEEPTRSVLLPHSDTVPLDSATRRLGEKMDKRPPVPADARTFAPMRDTVSPAIAATLPLVEDSKRLVAPAAMEMPPAGAPTSTFAPTLVRDTHPPEPELPSATAEKAEEL
jgi:hypothetical protein